MYCVVLHFSVTVVNKLIWNDWNQDHIAGHDVTKDEVEEVCQGKYIALDGHHGRFIIVGMTQAKRVLAVVIDPETEPGVYYPVTARPADRQERRLFYSEKGGEETHDKAA